MRVSISTGKNNFARIVRLAEAGQLIVVARSGKAVAVLGPLPPEFKPTPDEDQWLRDFLDETRITLDGKGEMSWQK